MGHQDQFQSNQKSDNTKIVWELAFFCKKFLWLAKILIEKDKNNLTMISHQIKYNNKLQLDKLERPFWEYPPQ